MDSTNIFDTETWLNLRGVKYIRSGQDVGAGWVGVKCPFCSDDPEYHLGVNLSNSRFDRNYIHCWRCGKKGNIVQYVKEIEKCDWGQAYRVIESHQDRNLIHLRTEQTYRRKQEGEKLIPEEASKIFLPCHLNYLRKRRYDPDILIPKYDLYACPYYGNYAYSLLAPVYMEHRMMTFVGIDVTGKRNERYKAAPKEQSVLFSKECVYGIDRCNKVGLVVEGLFDSWRIGDGAIATFGVEYTKAQIQIIAWALKRVYVMYDAEATDKADKLAWDLSIFMPKNRVEVLVLKKGDPDDLTEEEAKWVRKEVFGR